MWEGEEDFIELQLMQSIGPLLMPTGIEGQERGILEDFGLQGLMQQLDSMVSLIAGS